MFMTLNESHFNNWTFPEYETNLKNTYGLDSSSALACGMNFAVRKRIFCFDRTNAEQKEYQCS